MMSLCRSASRWGLLGVLCLAPVYLTAAGCGGRGEMAKHEQHLQGLAVFYGRYASQHRGMPPPNEQAFKQFIASQGPDALKDFAASTPDDLFVSPRDNQPYVVRYGTQPGTIGPDGGPIIAHEKQGADGQRYVARLSGEVEVLSSEEFAQAVPNV